MQYFLKLFVRTSQNSVNAMFVHITHSPGPECSGPLHTWTYAVCVVGEGEGCAPPSIARWGQGRAPLREAPSQARQPPLRNFGGSKLARLCIVCKPEPMKRAASVG
jgi:hypothetical protein